MTKALTCIALFGACVAVVLAQPNPAWPQYVAVMGNSQSGTLVGNPNSWGACQVTIDSNNMGYVNMSYQNMGSAWASSHLHGPAAFGSSAGVKISSPNNQAAPSTPAPNQPNSGTTASGAGVAFTAQEIADLDAFKYYCNIHSTANAGGEVRGQVYKSTNTYMAILDGAQASANGGATFVSQGMGWAYCMLTAPSTLTCNGMFRGLNGTVTAGHIHGPAKDGIQGAGVVVNFIGGSNTLSLGGQMGNFTVSTTLSNQQIVNMRSDMYYVNIHTTANPQGEIRGQLRMVNSMMSAAQTTGSFSAGCQPVAGTTMYAKGCLMGKGDGSWTDYSAMYSDSGCTMPLIAATNMQGIMNNGVALNWPGVDMLNVGYDQLTYIFKDVAGGMLPAGCECGGTWVNAVARTIMRQDCPTCGLFAKKYMYGVFNGTGLYTSPASITPATAWAQTQLNGWRYDALSSTFMCPDLVATSFVGAASAGAVLSSVTIVMAIAASLLASRQ